MILEVTWPLEGLPTRCRSVSTNSTVVYYVERAGRVERRDFPVVMEPQRIEIVGRSNPPHDGALYP